MSAVKKPAVDKAAKKEVAKKEVVKKAKEEDNDEEKSGSDSDSDVDEDGLNWWERENLQASKRGEQRWKTLNHAGPYFEPEYTAHGLPIRYAGQEIKMVPAVEEVATLFAVMRESHYYTNEVFRQNFFRSWRDVMSKHQPQMREVVRDLALCDFNAIWNWHVAEKDKKKKNAPREEKKRLADEKKKLTEKYQYCYWDGRKEKVANFRVEPPGLFRGRGKHPLTGKLKTRTYPEDITINIGKGEKVPECLPGHSWGKVIHDQTVTWLAMWTDNVTGNNKYVMLAPTSMIKGMSDREKFERARRLKGIIDTIRNDYRERWDSKAASERQLAVALYFIDKLALRVGNEKGGDEADTVGCCSLRKEHVTLQEGNKIHLDFLGKDSIRYSQTVEIDPKVHKLMEQLTKGKEPNEDIFDQMSPQQLNEYLKKHMHDLTAKVFRTYNASVCLDQLLRQNPPKKSATPEEKLIFFTKCNTEVAILCNHQKAVGKSYFKAQKNTNEKVEAMKLNIQRLEDLKDRIKKIGRKKALDEFYAEEDKIQHDWLAAYGTQKHKDDYAAYVAKRDETRAKEKDGDSSTSPAKKEKTSGTKRTRSSSSGKKENGKSKKGAKTEKKASKKSGKGKDIDVEADEDLASLLKKDKAASKGKGNKDKKGKSSKTSAKKPAAKAAKKAAKPAAKKAAPKKAGGKKK